MVPVIEGALTIWNTDGGFLPSDIEIGGKNLELWLAEQCGIPENARGTAKEGTYKNVRLIIEIEGGRSLTWMHGDHCPCYDCA